MSEGFVCAQGCGGWERSHEVQRAHEALLAEYRIDPNGS